MVNSALFVFIATIILGLFLTSLARRLAIRIGLVDCPDGRRKIHAQPVAVIGGIAIFVTVAVSLACMSIFLPDIQNGLLAKPTKTVSLLIAGSMIAIVGILDDLKNLRARYKLIGQFFAIMLLILGGDYLITTFSVFGFSFDLGYMAIPITVLWFLAAVNAINLLDGMDGMLGSMSLVILLGLGTMAIVSGHAFLAYIAIACAGAIVAFLRFNLPPATIYLGDCGSMLIGLTIGALAIDAAIKSPAVAILAPATLLVLPFLDTSAAIVRRKLTGRSFAIADRGHLHHVLMRKGFSIPRILMVITVLSALATTGAMFSIVLRSDALAIITIITVIAVLLVGRLFGGAEIRLIRERFVAIYRSMNGGHPHVEMEVRLQGETDWSEIWKQMTGCATNLNLTTVCLDVNAPAWHEAYHRRWSRMGVTEDSMTVWKVELPLFGHGQVIGRISVTGQRDAANMSEKLQKLSELVTLAETLMLLPERPGHLVQDIQPSNKAMPAPSNSYHLPATA